VRVRNVQRPSENQTKQQKASKVFNKAKINYIPIAQSIAAPWIQAETVVNRNYLRPSYMKIRETDCHAWRVVPAAHVTVQV